MNKRDRGILVGMVLGDAYLGIFKNTQWPNSWICNIHLKHSIKQKEYLEHKSKLLHSIFGGKEPKVVEFNNNGYPGVRCSKGNKYFRVLKKKMYKNGKKYISKQVLDQLTDEGLAIWWMDDGSLYMQRRDGKIHCREGILSTYVSLEENQNIVEWFKRKYDITVAIVRHKQYTRIRLNTHALLKLIPIISPHIVPSMKYKIDMQYPDTKKDKVQECPTSRPDDDIVRTYRMVNCKS